MHTNLMELVGKTYVVEDDGTGEMGHVEKSWCWQVPGKYGFIYPHGKDGTLAVCVESNRVALDMARELQLPVYLKGDFETVFLFPPKCFQIVARRIRAKKRRTITPDLRARLMARLAIGGKQVGRANFEAKTSAEESSSLVQDGF